VGPLHGVGEPVDLPDLLEGFVVNHSKHLIVMIGLLVVGATLFFSGSTGGWALFLLWPLACVVMMVFTGPSSSDAGCRPRCAPGR
jgi:hypothetical protein